MKQSGADSRLDLIVTTARLFGIGLIISVLGTPTHNLLGSVWPMVLPVIGQLVIAMYHVFVEPPTPLKKD